MSCYGIIYLTANFYGIYHQYLTNISQEDAFKNTVQFLNGRMKLGKEKRQQEELMIKVLPAHIATEMLRKKRKDRVKAMLESEISYDSKADSKEANAKSGRSINNSPSIKTSTTPPTIGCLENNRRLSVTFLANKPSFNLDEIRKDTSQQQLLVNKPNKKDNNQAFFDKQTRSKASGFHDLHIKSHSNVSILYADIVNFTPLADKFEPPELVNILNKLFSEFDQKADVFKLNLFFYFSESFFKKIIKI